MPNFANGTPFHYTVTHAYRGIRIDLQGFNGIERVIEEEKLESSCDEIQQPVARSQPPLWSASYRLVARVQSAAPAGES